MSRPPTRRSAAPGFGARAVAVALLASVVEKRQPLDATLENDKAFAALDTRDKALARAIVGTTLRHYGTIDAILSSLIQKRPRGAGTLNRILETATAQLLFMGVADHAAVSVAIDQLAADRDGAHFKGLANAVLRRIARERETLLAEFAMPEGDTPEWLWRRWVAAYGEATARAIADAHHTEPSLDLSVKSDPADWAAKLDGIVLPTGSVRTVAGGDVPSLAGYAEGQWWVQDAAAALPAKLLGDVAGKRIADLCAAPGGKTAQLAAAGAVVTAVDISSPRLERLAANLKRLNLAAETVASDVLKWQPAAEFDAILLDAPCTATGTIRRHPDVVWLKRAEDVAALAKLQAKMIDHALGLLKPGGTLVYCTCSLEPEEGEGHAAGRTVDPIRPDEVVGLAEIITPAGTIRTLPSHLPNANPRLAGLDGFFVMRLRK
ncbi:MAG TPA: transcription antitermination factor NusB [Bauldia sp.]|nr:transcription antitermination factor NusB [Bauldia sp.]